MRLDEHIMLWNHASVKVLDIRRIEAERDSHSHIGSRIHSYRLPANAYICSSRGSAIVRLDDETYRMDGVQVLHGAAGVRLQFIVEDVFDYWLVLYKASLSLPRTRRWFGLPPSANPFRQSYSCKPLYPLVLQTQLEQMHLDWSSGDPMLTLRARARFHQFVWELLHQLEQAGSSLMPPDLLAQAVLYLELHYRQPISLEQLAATFGCSVSYLTKLFRKRLQTSPMRHLTGIRMEAAAHLLLTSERSLQQIAEQVGYPDAHTLSRSFKKHYGYAPSRYKEMTSQRSVPELPVTHTRSALLPASDGWYSVNEFENHSHLKRRGGVSLYSTKRSATLTAATLMLGVSLLLSACAGSPAPGGSEANNTGNGGPSANTTAAANTQEATTTGATRTYTSSVFGSVTVPDKPERIVDLTGSAIGNLLQLDIKPIASVDYGLVNPFHDGLLEGIENIGDGSNLEAILELNPDLIIVFSYVGDEIYEQLTQIAPTVRLEYGAQKPSELLLEFGKITGKEQEAEAWIKAWDAKIAEVKPAVREAVGDRTVAIMQPHAKGIYAWGNKGGRGGEIIYDEFELTPPALVRQHLIDGELAGQDFSLEQLPDYAGDIIFTSIFGWDEGEVNGSAVYDSAIWKSLDAVKNGLVFNIDPQGYYYNDPISLDQQLDFITASLLGE